MYLPTVVTSVSSSFRPLHHYPLMASRWREHTESLAREVNEEKEERLPFRNIGAEPADTTYI